MTVRLGTPISAYGQESRNRAARQRIPHRAWTDGSGVEHHQVMLRVGFGIGFESGWGSRGSGGCGFEHHQKRV